MSGKFGSLQGRGPLAVSPSLTGDAEVSLPPSLQQRMEETLGSAAAPALPSGASMPVPGLERMGNEPYVPSMQGVEPMSAETATGLGLDEVPQDAYQAGVVPPTQYAEDIEDQGARLAETTQPLYLGDTAEETNRLLQNINQEMHGYAPKQPDGSRQHSPIPDKAAENLHQLHEMSKEYLRHSWMGPSGAGDGFNAEGWNRLQQEANIPDTLLEQRGMGAITGGLALAASNFTENSVRQGQEKRAGLRQDEEEVDVDPFADLGERSAETKYDAEKTFNKFTPEMLEDRGHPLLRGQLNGLGESFYRAMNRPKSGTEYTPQQDQDTLGINSIASAMGVPGVSKGLSNGSNVLLAQSMMDMGLLKLGVDKKGRYFLFPTKAMQDYSRSLQEVNHAYDPQSRLAATKTQAVLSQSFPEKSALPAGKQAQVTKNMRIENAHNIAATAVAIDNATGIKRAPRAEFVRKFHEDILLKGIYVVYNQDGTPQYRDILGRNVNPSVGPQFSPEQIQFAQKRAASADVLRDANSNELHFAYSFSPFAATQYEVSPEEFQSELELKTRHLISQNGTSPEEAQKLAFQHVVDSHDTKTKIGSVHVYKYIPMMNTPQFGHMAISRATARMFQQATNVNVQAHSDTIRMAFEMVGNEHQIAQFGRSDTKTEFHRSIDAALNALTSTQLGEHFGDDVHQKLLKMDRSTLVKAEVIYMIARAFDDHFGGDLLPATQFNRDPVTVLRAVKERGHDFMNVMAERGRDILSWEANPDSLPMTEDAAPDWVKQLGGLTKLFSRKEWAYATDAAKMAAQFVDKAHKGGVVTFNGLAEYDGRQSNAYIISNIIGATAITNLLGGAVDTSGIANLPNFKDLRKMIVASLGDDITKTFNGEDDAWIAEAMDQFMEDAREELGQSGVDFAKWYARGLVVAGLYGKAPQYMFSEIDDMRLAAPSAFNNLERVYEAKGYSTVGAVPEHYKDIANLLSTSMYTNMSELQGYQTLLRSLGEMLAATNGSTEIKTFLDMVIDIGDIRFKAADGASNLISLNVDGQKLYANMPKIARDIHSSGQLRKGNIEGLQDHPEFLDLIRERTHGEQARNALPVDLIQSGDAAMMMVTMLMLQTGVGNNQLPRNMKSVHDAVIVPPGSVFLALNAMNNITPFFIAKQGPDIIKNIRTNILTGMRNMVTRAQKEGTVNVGLEGDYPSLFGYFDRLHINTYHREDQTGKKKRGTSEQKTSRKVQNDINKQVLEQAYKLGWRPPVESFRDERQYVNATAEQVQNMLTLMQASSGWMNPEAKPPVGLSVPKDYGNELRSLFVHRLSRNIRTWEISSAKKPSILARNRATLTGRRGRSGWNSNTQ